MSASDGYAISSLSPCGSRALLMAYCACLRALARLRFLFCAITTRFGAEFGKRCADTDSVVWAIKVAWAIKVVWAIKAVWALRVGRSLVCRSEVKEKERIRSCVC